MNTVNIEEGKVYLRDTRNGNVHPYEELLAQMDYMKPFIGGSEQADAGATSLNITLTGLERAAEYDKLVAMTPAEREEYLQGRPAPWERTDYLNAADTVPPPPGAPKARKAATTTTAAPTAPPAPPQGEPALVAPTNPPLAAQAVSAQGGEVVPLDTRETSLQPGVETSLTPNAVTSNESKADIEQRAAEVNMDRLQADAQQQAATETAAVQATAQQTAAAQKRYRLSAKADGYTLQGLRDAGWTNETLLSEGYLEEVKDNG